ncbi:MAG TPA: hypothetical protein VNI01_09040 [Elusimicrobiota bacterium]|nr:hypothetical protein [Elusimicrobiota bacterium]
MEPDSRRWAAAPCAATSVVLAAAAFPLSPLRGTLGNGVPSGVSLYLPWTYVATGPLSAWADAVTFNSARQDAALVAWIAAGYWLARGALKLAGRGWAGWRRELLGYGAWLAAFAAFLAWAILLPRPMARILLGDPNMLALDFHSHTSYSHDGRRSFTPTANVHWHVWAGFTAAFITDHNRIEGAREARALYDRGGINRAYRPLIGEEVSLQDAHVGVLGPREAIDNRPYDGSREGLRRFLGECESRFGGLPVLNLPEYRLHYWDRLDEVASWGARGIELVNAVPKALDMSDEERQRVHVIARARKLFMVGVSDNHGWGSATYVWNLMYLPGQASLGAAELQAAVLAALREKGPDAVAVIVRAKQDPLPGAWIALDPFLGLWTMLRAFEPAQAVATVAWVWGLALLRRRRARRASAAIC